MNLLVHVLVSRIASRLIIPFSEGWFIVCDVNLVKVASNFFML